MRQRFIIDGIIVNDLDRALEEVLSGRPVSTPVTNPIGCGGRGAPLVASLLQMDADVQLAAIVDPDEARVRERLKDVDLSDVSFYADHKALLGRKEGEKVPVELERGGKIIKLTVVVEKIPPRPAVKVEGLVNGLRYKAYEGLWKDVPDFDKLGPAAARPGASSASEDVLSPACSPSGDPGLQRLALLDANRPRERELAAVLREGDAPAADLHGLDPLLCRERQIERVQLQAAVEQAHAARG